MAATRLGIGIAALSLVVLVGACGGDNNGPAASPTPSQAPVTQLPIPDPWEVHVAAADGGGTMVFAADVYGEFAWSPDGAELAVATGGFDSSVLRFVGLDGEVRYQTQFDGWPLGLEWSPDGSYVATVVSYGSSTSLIAISSDGSGHKDIFQATDAGYLLLSGWLPSGELLVVKGEATLPGELLVFDIGAGSSRTVAGLDFYADFLGRPALSPDGRSLAVITELADKGCGTPSTGNAISVIALESGDVAQVSPGGYCGGGGIVWSPDGTQIAFSMLGIPGSAGAFVADVATGETRQLTPGLRNVVAWLDETTILAQQFVCVQCDGGGLPELLLIDAISGQEREVAGNVPTAVSGTGEVVVADEGIRVVDLHGKPVRELAASEAGWRYFSPKWSPDASHVAYARSREARQHIYEVRSDGSQFEMVAGHLSPTLRLSPDGTRMAYVDARDSTKDVSRAQLVLADADAGNQIDVGVEGVLSFTWSTDGGRLIFATSGLEGGASTLYLVNADGSDLHEIGTTTTISVGSLPGIWSPDGTMVAFASGDIFVVEVETGRVTFLAQNPAKLITSLSWSSDSERLVFGRGMLGQNGSEIVIVDVDNGGSVAILDDDRYSKTSAVFSPDGDQIAFLASGPEKSTKLAVVNSDGSAEQTIAQGVLLGPSIAWSPSGDSIAAAIALEGRGGLFLIRPDGSEKRQLTQSAGFTDIAWLDGDTIRFTTYISRP